MLKLCESVGKVILIFLLHLLTPARYISTKAKKEKNYAMRIIKSKMKREESKMCDDVQILLFSCFEISQRRKMNVDVLTSKSVHLLI